MDKSIPDGCIRRIRTLSSKKEPKPLSRWVGGITPWIKVAHMAEAHNVAVCPHFLMELHVSLVCAIPNGPWLEYIPQLDGLTATPMRIENGRAFPSQAPGLGIDWDHDRLAKDRIEGLTFSCS